MSALSPINIMGGVVQREEASPARAGAPPSPPKVNTGIGTGVGASISNALRQSDATAQAQAVGEQFEYRLRRPVTIRRNESALLPILQSDIDGEEELPIEERHYISSINSDLIDIWVGARSIDTDTERQLRQAADKRSEVSGFDEKIRDLENEQTGIFNDQSRLRENLQRLGQTPDEASLRMRYIKQLDSQEDRIEIIKTEREKLEAAKAAAQKQLDDLIRKLSVDRKI